MGRSNVRVIVRARPTASYASENFQFNEASDSIDMRLPKDDHQGHVNNQQESWHFKVDKVLSNASQEQVFDNCAIEVVRSVMDGYNGTIMAYGQTGAGKTHTMTGGHVGFADRGIVPRSISHIYAEAAARPENNITIKLSYVEIYNELMFDLLTDVGIADQPGDLTIVEDARANIHVKGLSTPVGGTEENALHTFFEGDTNRHVAEHALNKGSTRSHCVFTIYVESRSRVESSEKVIYSKLHLVDLAGSERVKKTGTEGSMLVEATHINKSLTFLEQVVVALGSKSRDHVPYRQSKLTHMLKDSLGGNCKTTMVANVWPEAKMMEETQSTLRFAQRMMRVSNEATVNVHLDPQMLLRKYERQVKDLKQELAMYDTLAGRSQVQRDEFNPDETRELEGKLKQYINGEVADPPQIQSLRMVYEGFAIFKKLYNEQATELSKRPMGAAAMAGGGDEAGDGAPAAAYDNEEQDGQVGDYEEERGVSVPARGEGNFAPSNSRPPADDYRNGNPAGEAGDSADGTGNADATRARQPADGERAPDKQISYSEWKTKEGAKFQEAFDRNRHELKDARARMKDAQGTANTKKKEIDEAKERLQRKQLDKGATTTDEELIDEEEYALIKNLKETKQEYKRAFEEHRMIKMELQQIEHLMQQCKIKTAEKFEEWYDQKFGALLRATEPAAQAAPGERYDPQEMFDLMEAEKLETQHPDALAYHKARKNAARDVRQKKIGGPATTARGGR